MITRVNELPNLIGVAQAGAPGALSWVIGLGGVLLAVAWTAWRFGPTIARYVGVAWWWIGWCCGIGGGYGYAIFFIASGTVSWSIGTVWFAARRGYWPSLLSRRMLAGVLRSREHPAVLPATVGRPPRRSTRP